MKRRILPMLLALAMVTGVCGVSAPVTIAAKTKKIVVVKGKSQKVTFKKAKNVKWNIKNKKIASVKKSGKNAITIKGKKIGNTKLTIKYKVKGKWKTGKYKVVVKKKAAQVSLTSLKATNERTLQFTLSRACALTVNDVSVKAKKNKAGIYRRVVKVTGLVTNDKKTYTVQLYGNEGLYNNDYIMVNIPKLTGTKILEAQYKEKAVAYTGDSICSASIGEHISKEFYVYENVGYVNYTVSNLPQGLTYVVRNNELYVEGYPTKAGVYNTVIKAVDEVGNTYTQTCRFCIGSSEKLAATALDVYILDGGYVSKSIAVAGGSGSYTYSKKDDATGLGFDFSNGSVSGTIQTPGTYTVSIVVTDSNNAALTTTVSYRIHVKKGVTIEGTVKDLTGSGIAYDAYVMAKNVNKNSKYLTSSGSYVNDKGGFSMKLEPGTWNLTFSHRNSDEIKFVYNVVITKDRKLADVTLKVCPVILVHPQGVTDFNGISWRDKNGNMVGSGSKIWVKPGTHTVEAVKDKTVLYTVLNKATATFTASNKLLQVAVKAIPETGNLSFSVVNGTFTSHFNGRYTYFIYVPAETGLYNIYSNTGLDTAGIIYNADCKVITSSDLATDFKMENVSLTAGQTYYIGAGFWSASRSGEFTVYVEKQA